MTFYISAVSEDGSDAIMESVEADTFEDAVDLLHRLGRCRWPGQVWRPTSVTEVPSRGPVGLAFQILSSAA